MNVEQARFNMIEQQIRPWDVLEPSVLGLLARVRREDFVPEAHQTLAFVEVEGDTFIVVVGDVFAHDHGGLADRQQAFLL